MDRYQELRELPFTAVASALEIDLSKFKARKGGTEWSGPCPITLQKRNKTSFSYAQDGRWHCFAHGESGRGVIDLTMKVRGIGFQAAVELLQSLTATPIRAAEAAQTEKLRYLNQSPPQVNQPSENPAKRFTYDKHFVPCPWLTARGFSPETLTRYGVGLYDNPSRQSAYKGKVLIRIQRFSDGEVVGYLARDIRPAEERGDGPKYVFPVGVHKALELFGAWQIKEDAPIRVLYLVESPLCVLKLHQLGFPAVSTYGWSVSPQQADIIQQLCKGVVWLPDRDKYQEAMSQLGILTQHVWTRMPELPEGVNDPEHLSPEQIRALT